MSIISNKIVNMDSNIIFEIIFKNKCAKKNQCRLKPTRIGTIPFHAIYLLSALLFIPFSQMGAPGHSFTSLTYDGQPAKYTIPQRGVGDF